MYSKSIKRVLDLVGSFFVFLVLFPIILIATIVLFFINNCSNPFFIQERPGKNAKLFKLIKYKTMTDKKDAKGVLLPDEHRLTKVGRFIRSISIDELPQILNVLKGDMSLVGPRPLLIKYLSLYTVEQSRRHEVRPGITGWAQVNGRNDISWGKKIALDIWYVDNCSFALDMKIIFLTILKTMRREGVTKKGFATTDSFLGNNDNNI